MTTAAENTMPDNPPAVHTYHCICSEVAVATFSPLQRLEKRQSDGAAICTVAASPIAPPASEAVLFNTAITSKEAMVLKLEDGFEKRYAIRCSRCDLQFGYMLDHASFGEGRSGIKSDAMYLLPGGLVSTEDLKEKKDLSGQVEMVSAG